MATIDDKDKKIGEVPHLEKITGEEKIPVSANGEPRYVEVQQIREGLQPSGNYLTEEEADKRYAGVNDIPDVSDFVTGEEVDEKLANVRGVTWGRIGGSGNVHVVGTFNLTSNYNNNNYIYFNGEKIFLDQEFDWKSSDVLEYGYSPTLGTYSWFYQELVSLDVCKVDKALKNTSGLFTGQIYLERINLKGLNTSESTSLRAFFQNCAKLTTIENIDSLDTSQVTDMSSMFNGCKLLESLDLSAWNTENLMSVSSMFFNCSNLKYLNLAGWNIRNLNLSSFINSGGIVTLNISGWDFENIEKISNYLSFSSVIDVIGPVYNISQNIDLSLSKKLSSDSAMVFINGLKDGLSNKITFYQSVYNSLTPEQIAVATAKGWTVAKA